MFFTFFTCFKPEGWQIPPPPRTQHKNLVSRRDVVTVDEDRDPERGDKEEIGMACTRSRKMINETGRTMELGRKVGFLLFFPLWVFESFHAISTNRRNVGSRESSRSFRKRGRLLLLSCQKHRFFFFFQSSWVFPSIIAIFCSLSPRAVKSKLIVSWWTLILRFSLMYISYNSLLEAREGGSSNEIIFSN